MSEPQEIPDRELQRRVLFSLLSPVVRMARLFRVPVKELTGWVEAAYFQELRAQGLTLKEIGGALGVSERTAVNLSKKLRDRFLLPEHEHNLPRRIEFLLGVRAMGEGRIKQLLPEVDPREIDLSLAALLQKGRIKEVQGRTLKYALAQPVVRLPRDTWMARVGALNSFAENLTNAVYGRFFRREPRAFARTVTFQGSPEVYQRLGAFYEEVMLPQLRAMMAEAKTQEEGDQPEQNQAVQVSLCWAPYEYTRDAGQTENQGSEES
jgi:hypothetical protein